MATWTLLLGAAVAGALYAIVRPRLLRWGATAEEVRMRYPGDERTPARRAPHPWSGRDRGRMRR